jgi:hypothetical protein
MNISDETLMAFADGELDATESAAVEKAMRENPDIEKRVARHRALKDRVRLAYSAELMEPVPERLLAAARRGPGKVVDLGEARASHARQATASALAARAARVAAARRRWQPLGTVAAGVLLGLGLGYGIWQQNNGLLTRDSTGVWVARGDLDAALSHQLAAEQTATSKIRMGVSYLTKAGEYCRTFQLSGTSVPSGIACRGAKEWRIELLAQSAAGAAEYRTAGSDMPPLLLKSIETEIKGEPLDQAGEATARAQGWQPATR